MIKLLIFGLMAFMIIHYLRYKKYINPYKLYMVFGKKGSGKSTFLVKKALEYKKKGYIIYTNMDDLTIDNVRHIKEDDLGPYVPEENSVILWDEAGMKFDNRNFKQFKPETRDFFKLQRHYKCIVYLASQTWDIDVKLRNLTDKMYLVQNVGIVYSLVRPITRKITLTEPIGDQESRITEKLKFEWIFSWKIYKMTKYFKYFESFNIPEKPSLPFSIQDLKK